MRNKCLKRIVAVFLAALMCLASTVAVFAEGETPEYDEVIAIIHTNDVHGHIDIEPYVKGLAKSMENDYSLVLTVSAGDVYSGGHAVAGYYNGELIPAIMDQVYDVMVPGNNDFPANGIAGNKLLSSLYKRTKTICANIKTKNAVDVAANAAAYTPKIGKEDFAAMYEGVSLNGDALDYSALNLGTIAADTSPWDATATFTTKQDTKIGLFGLTCTLGQMESMGYGNTVEAAKAATASLKNEGADVIVGVAHTGWTGEGSTTPSQVNDTNSWVVASEAQDMDALIDSHTHSIINNGEGCLVGANEVLVNQASCYGACIGVMKFYLKDHKVVAKTAELLTGDAITAITPDTEVKAKVDAAYARLNAIAGDPVATTPYYLNGGTDFTNAGGNVRANETNMGDFITDVLRAAASEKAGVNFAFSFIPGYCVRSSVEESADITNIEIASIFDANVSVKRLGAKVYTAQEIVDMVTKALSAVNPSFGKEFMQFSGISVTYYSELAEDGKTTKGVPVQIKVGDTLIYDLNKGGIQVAEDWNVNGLRTLHPNDNVWEGDEEELLAKNVNEVRALFHEYLEKHEEGEDYVFFPNAIAPDNRIVEVPKMTYHPAVVATCEKAGHQEYWVNEETGKMYADLYGTQEIVKLETIPPTGHKWDAGKVTKYPTTKTTGTMLFTCKNDKKHTKTVTIPKLKANTIKVKVSKKAIKASALNKKAQSFKIVVTKAKGKVTITPNAKAKKAGIKVSKKGVVVLPKNCKAGTYKITVKAAGDKLKYAPGAKAVTIKVTKKGAVIIVK